MYEIRYDEEAIEFLERLPKPKRKQIFDAVSKTKSNPHRFFKRLRGSWGHCITIGKVRVIADLAERRERIKVTRIEYRSRAYLNK